MEAVHDSPPPYATEGIDEKKEDISQVEQNLKPGLEESDAFGNEEFAEIKYKTLKWWYVSVSSASHHCTFIAG